MPEDIKTVVGNWPAVVGETSMPMKKYLKDARLSLGGDNKLMVVVEDGLASDYFLKQEGNKALLEQHQIVHIARHTASRKSSTLCHTKLILSFSSTYNI